MFGGTPVIKLGDHFKGVCCLFKLHFLTLLINRASQISEFQERFQGIPNMIDLDHLTVSGNVFFGRNVILRGTVIGAYSA